MTLVAGVDTSTQSCKIVVRDLETGALVREGRAAHPDGTEVDPNAWWDAFLEAVRAAGGLEDVAAISVAGQQHGMVALAQDGTVVRDALLWNDTRSAPQVKWLNGKLGNAQEWVTRTGLSLVPSFTITKIAWLAQHEPDNAARVAAVALPHDWLTWRLRGFGPQNPQLDQLTTDRSDASGTGYWSGQTEDYIDGLIELAFGRLVMLPTVLGPLERAGVTGEGIPGVAAGVPVGVGAGDNAAAALALDLAPGDAVISLGTSGTVYARTSSPVTDPNGVVAGFADATGDFLPLIATLNAARNVDAAARILGIAVEDVAALALEAAPGAGGLTLVPYFEGERTPNLPDATASLHGMTLTNTTRENLARAAVEGTLSALLVGVHAVEAAGVPIERVAVIGGGAKSAAVQAILPQMVDAPVFVPPAGEYVANGAAKQAVAALTGEFPDWDLGAVELPRGERHPEIFAQHQAAKQALDYPL